MNTHEATPARSLPVTTLEEQIMAARTDIVSDGYDMSVGEIINLYKDKEIIINPAFQRMFRWDSVRKTRFIESLLLGIPIPPIFVYQNERGVWELIDGLQRLSTIFEFVGVLRDKDNDNLVPPSVLTGTRFLPGLDLKRWESSGPDSSDGIGQLQHLQIKRSRIRVEILKKESDPKAKYELFQRLNTGGAGLSEQEVRNCIAVMLNKPFYDWYTRLSENTDFLKVVDQTETALEKQMASELVIRFLVFRLIPYKQGLDVHEYLDDALVTIASDCNYPQAHESEIFNSTFKLLSTSLGSNSFKRWDGGGFKGQFLMSLFEVVATGVSINIDLILSQKDPTEFIRSRCILLSEDPVFKANSGAGIRGTTRLSKLIPLAAGFFKP